MKHEAHVCDGGGVPAQWLVEGPRFLPRVVRGAGRAAGQEAGGSGRARRARSVQRGERVRLCADWGAVRGEAADLKSAQHVRDAGGVPAQWLVEGPRVLPRVASRAHGAGRALPAGVGEVAGDRGACT